MPYKPAHGIRCAGASQQGFAYLAILLFVAVFGALSAGVVAAGSAMARRAAEQDLLFVGSQFRNAIRSYYEAGAGGRRYAVSLEELLRDPRIPGVHRYLRRIYTDPMTGAEDWGLVLAPEGVGIMGVYSKAEGTPLKVDGFPLEFANFKDSAKYSNWVFSYAPQAGQAEVAAPNPPNAVPQAGNGAVPGAPSVNAPGSGVANGMGTGASPQLPNQGN